jgi:glutathione S-transferase
MTAVTLYVVPGSHPSMAGRLMLEHKRIDYRRIDLLPALHKPLLRAFGFKATTVPALRLNGRRLQDTVAISMALEQLFPEPPLFPADQALRAQVRDAELWGESVLQPLPRRLSWWALGRQRSALRSFAEGARLHVPLGPAVRTAAPIIAIERRINAASDEAVRGDMEMLPGMLDRVDELLAAGVLSREQISAADYQIATSVRLLLCFDDLRSGIGRRPAGEYARSVVPNFPGRVEAVIPQEWLSEGLR